MVVIKHSVSSLNNLESDIKEAVSDNINTLTYTFYRETLPKVLVSSETINMYFNKVSLVFRSWQGEYFDPSPIVKQTDRTGFDFWDSAIKAEIKQNLTIAANDIEVEKGASQLNFTVLSDEFLGLTGDVSDEDTTPIRWARYFIEGPTVGQDVILLWVTPELNNELIGESGSLGRFGTGHLWSLKGAKEIKRMRAIMGEKGYDMSKYIHPQSGMTARGGELEASVASAPVTEVIVKRAFKMAEKTYFKNLRSKG